MEATAVGRSSPIPIATTGYQRCCSRMLRTSQRSLNRWTSADATPAEEPAHVGEPDPRVTAWGQQLRPCPWWARWSADHDNAEFWNVAAPKANIPHRIGGDAR